MHSNLSTKRETAKVKTSLLDVFVWHHPVYVALSKEWKDGPLSQGAYILGSDKREATMGRKGEADLNAVMMGEKA